MIVGIARGPRQLMQGHQLALEVGSIAQQQWVLYVDGRVYLAREWKPGDGASTHLHYKVIEAGFVGEDDGMGIVATHGGAEKDKSNVKADLGYAYVPNPSCARAIDGGAP